MEHSNESSTGCESRRGVNLTKMEEKLERSCVRGALQTGEEFQFFLSASSAAVELLFTDRQFFWS